MYLIPCHLLTTHTLPSAQLLQPYPGLQKRFLKLAVAIKKGDLRAFDQALAESENEFVKRRIYLTLERGRDIALRNLLRKVFIAGGFVETKEGEPPVRRTRVPVAEFTAAIKLSGGEDLDADEVECLLANMIYKVCHILIFCLSCCWKPRAPFHSPDLASLCLQDLTCAIRLLLEKSSFNGYISFCFLEFPSLVPGAPIRGFRVALLLVQPVPLENDSLTGCTYHRTS
jgi:hypothetical protein